MSNTPSKRPAPGRKVTSRNVKQADDELDEGLAVTDNDGARLQVRVRDVRGSHDAALVAACGMDFMTLLGELNKRQGLDLLAASFWFCRIVNGRTDKTYFDVLDEFGYEDFEAMNLDRPKVEADPPKASVSSS